MTPEFSRAEPEPSVPCPLRRAAEAHSEGTAIVSPERALSFAEWDDLASCLAGRLRGQVLERGDRVAILADRDWRCLVLLLACWRAGLVAVPLSTRLPRAGVIKRLRQVEAIALLTDRPASFAEEETVAHALDVLFADLSDEPPRDEARWMLEAPASIVFTSGSTGRPKPAQHSFRNHLRSAEGANRNMPLEPGDRWLLALPLYHVGGLGVVVRCLLEGATVVIPEASRKLGELVASHEITHVSVVPTQVRRLLDEEEPGGLTSLKAMLVGGAPLSEPLLERAFERGWPLFTTYGLTEMTSQVTTTPSGASLERLRGSGPPLPHRQIKVAKSGEILVRGETLFQGYVEGRTLDPAIDTDGWFHTRDLGRLDSRGDLHVTGRLDHQFISGGENIQPEVVEAALCRLADIVRAVVVPVPDEEYGERPIAFLETETGVIDAPRYEAALREIVPSFMVPDAFYGWPDGLTGMKVSRSQLASEARRRTAT